MKFKSISRLVAGLLTALASVNAWAANPGVICTPGNFSYSTSYSTSTTVDTVTMLSFNVNCTRNSTGSLIQVNYSVTFDDGIHRTGLQNRAQNGLFLNYEFYKDAACTLKLEGANTYTGTTPPMDASLSYVIPNTFYACIPKTQAAVAPSLSYTDTVTLTIDGSKVGTGAFDFVPGGNGSGSVNIIAPPACSISTPPGNISLNYTAFQSGVLKGNTLFRVTCSNTLAYTMKITDINNTILVTDAVAAGLNYSLGVSSTINGAPANPFATTGNGAPQDGYIIVTVPANQAGSCLSGCSATNTHYLTLEY